MQEIVFNPYAKPNMADYGLLYVCIGDGGAVEDGYPHIPKGRNQVWGKVLRIDPQGNNSKNGAYGIPKTNPYFGKKGLGEIFAEGFRNPNRISWTTNGKMLVSNIGQHQIESLYWLKAGKNYGWPYREGTFAIDTAITINELYALPKNDAKYGYSYPVAQFDHDEGNAIMGGFEYIGKEIPSLKGKYIFGEVVRGRVFYVNINEIVDGKQAVIHEFPLNIDGKLTTLKETTKQNKVDFRIGKDAIGEMYIFTKSDGVMYKIVK
jgi:glucose/arabinose dehydrogenase